MSTTATTTVPGTELLPAQHQRLAAEVRAFADDVVAPASYAYDTERRLPMEIIARMGAMGLFGLPIPIELGGQGRDYLSLCVAVEQLARVDQSIAVTLEAGVGLGAMPILRFGTREHLGAITRRLQEVLINVASAHMNHRDLAHTDDGNQLEGQQHAHDAAMALRRAAVLMEDVGRHVNDAQSHSGRIAWHGAATPAEREGPEREPRGTVAHRGTKRADRSRPGPTL